MQDLGHPIIGDGRYGREDAPNPIGRLALHAFKLCFYHPVTGDLMEFETPYPAEFKKLFLKNKFLYSKIKPESSLTLALFLIFITILLTTHIEWLSIYSISKIPPIIIPCSTKSPVSSFRPPNIGISVITIKYNSIELYPSSIHLHSKTK